MEKEELLLLYQQIYQKIQPKLPVHDEHDALFILDVLVDSLLQKTDKRPIPPYSLFSQYPIILDDFQLLLENTLIKAFEEKSKHEQYVQQLKKIAVSVENIVKVKDSFLEDQEHIREQLKFVPPGAVRIRLRKLANLDLLKTTIQKEEGDFLVDAILKIKDLSENKIVAFDEAELGAVDN